MANNLKIKQDEVKDILKKEYNILVSNKWFDKYLYFYSKCIQPLKKITMSDALDYILDNPDTFAYFIFGHRCEYVNNKFNGNTQQTT